MYNSDFSDRRRNLSKFLEDLSKGLSEIRGVVLQNRRDSLERVRGAIIDNTYRLAHINLDSDIPGSPPHLRSRGRAQDIPNVMSKPLERK